MCTVGLVFLIVYDRLLSCSCIWFIGCNNVEVFFVCGTASNTTRRPCAEQGMCLEILWTVIGEEVTCTSVALLSLKKERLLVPGVVTPGQRGWYGCEGTKKLHRSHILWHQGEDSAVSCCKALVQGFTLSSGCQRSLGTRFSADTHWYTSNPSYGMKSLVHFSCDNWLWKLWSAQVYTTNCVLLTSVHSVLVICWGTGELVKDLISRPKFNPDPIRKYICIRKDC